MANPLKYVSDTVTGTKPTYNATTKYGSQVDAALGNVTNFSYDPLKDASYQALAKIYTKRGEKAARNTMGDAATLNGGLATSYATSAAQQTRNDYNQELAALIPDLEDRAYSRSVDTLNALRDADDSETSKNQWQYSQDYQAYRDAVADSQWAKNYNLDIYALKKANSGGGGGRRSSGGSSYSSGSGSLLSYDDVVNAINGGKSGNKSGNKTTIKTPSYITQKQTASAKAKYALGKQNYQNKKSVSYQYKNGSKSSLKNKNK